ncbi:hypothetical protein [Bacillus sp. S/N-304-OC-R1]|uniref:hypothetical protein n=1 Tax=Bacillus sp. S/N-304-OC-R1 TaxID=2758034 RepID=UPI001C8DBE11|nr:hypothetical protein [Bacillus sp. S/N-304-OC-R1]MBY0121263.1 hypothetical protein [Bacillus sp. S/N-304-OC-R1]
MNSIFDLDTLILIQDEEEWKKAYEKEIHKLDNSFRELAEIEFNELKGMDNSLRLEEIQNEHNQLFMDSRFLSHLEYWEKKVSDVFWKRRLSVLMKKVMESRIESDFRVVKIKQALQEKIMNKLIVFNSEEIPMAKVQTHFMNNPDRILRKALLKEANIFGEELSSEFKKLIEVRNQLAKEEGFDNYHSYLFNGIYNLSFQEYFAQGSKLIKGVENISAEWENQFRDKFGWDKSEYSDVLYTALNYFDIPESLFLGEKIIDAYHFTCRHFGLEPEHLPISFDLYDIPFGGLMSAISYDDIRIMVKKRNGFSGFSVGLHEMGHAIYEYFSSRRAPELFRFKNIIGHEIMAEIFMTIASQREWLEDFLEVDSKIIEKIKASEHLFSLTLTKLYFYQSILEQKIYENPNQDLQALANSVFEEIYDIKAEAIHPATDMMYLLYPVYTHNYIYAYAARDMIRSKFEVEGLYKSNTLFDILKTEFMEPTEEKDWIEKIRLICDEDFTFKYFEKYLYTGTLQDRLDYYRHEKGHMEFF